MQQCPRNHLQQHTIVIDSRLALRQVEHGEADDPPILLEEHAMLTKQFKYRPDSLARTLRTYQGKFGDRRRQPLEDTQHHLVDGELPGRARTGVDDPVRPVVTAAYLEYGPSDPTVDTRLPCHCPTSWFTSPKQAKAESW